MGVYEREPVAVWGHPACLEDDVLLARCTASTGRGSGPGGQHRNKVETEVVIVDSPTGESGRAGERRSQVENRKVALRRLRLNLATNVRTDVPRGPVGSRLWRSRVRRGRISVSVRSGDFPALLAEALDVIAASGWDARTAALRLECTPSQLVKFVSMHPSALAAWNDQRSRLGLSRLR